MTGARARMMKVFEASYQRFRERLRWRLGSDALATEVLHETWLRIARIDDVGLVQQPEAYLFRMALNVAADQREKDNRKLAASEIEAIRHTMDGALDPERIAEARAELAMLRAALEELTPRRKAILLLARLDNVKHEEIAERFGISPRMVEKELLNALRHCSNRLERKLNRRFSSGPRKGS
ncbi:MULTISPECIES: RNA polymerase sigma factor [unclassified Bradyrhizobium]